MNFDAGWLFSPRCFAWQQWIALAAAAVVSGLHASWHATDCTYWLYLFLRFTKNLLFCKRFQRKEDHLRPLLMEINETFAVLAKRFENFPSGNQALRESIGRVHFEFHQMCLMRGDRRFGKVCEDAELARFTSACSLRIFRLEAQVAEVKEAAVDNYWHIWHFNIFQWGFADAKAKECASLPSNFLKCWGNVSNAWARVVHREVSTCQSSFEKCRGRWFLSLQI